MSKLFESATLGGTVLRNRIVMAPMTRSRAIGNVANDLMVKYYGMRADAGLIITEGTSPSPNGLGYARIPGLFRHDQVTAWKGVTEAVHGRGGRIFVQLMHAGRVGHPENLPEGARLVAPSPLAAPGRMWTDTRGMQPHPIPEEMSEADIQQAIAEYAQASGFAVDAGFDGIELHGANGYLIEQFLNVASNQRMDRWGGSVENRIRFAIEVAEAAVAAVGAERVGMRISPYGVFNGMKSDEHTSSLYEALARELSSLRLAYIHVVDHSAMGAPSVPDEMKATIRTSFKGAYILSGGYDRARAEADLEAGKGDLVAFGRPFVANPDLVHKLKTDAPLREPDSTAFYTPGAKGYIDYPAS